MRQYKIEDSAGNSVSLNHDELEMLIRGFNDAKISLADLEDEDAGSGDTGKEKGKAVDSTDNNEFPEELKIALDLPRSDIDRFVAEQVAEMSSITYLANAFARASRNSNEDTAVAQAGATPSGTVEVAAVAAAATVETPKAITTAQAPPVQPVVAAPAANIPLPQPFAPPLNHGEVREIVKEAAVIERDAMLANGGEFPVIVNLVALFGERPSEHEVLQHPVYRYGFKHNPIPVGTQKPQGFKMVVISAGTDVGMFTSWHTAGEHVVGVSSNIFKTYRTYGDAALKWKTAVMDGNVKMIFVE